MSCSTPLLEVTDGIVDDLKVLIVGEVVFLVSFNQGITTCSGVP